MVINKCPLCGGQLVIKEYDKNSDCLKVACIGQLGKRESNCSYNTEWLNRRIRVDPINFEDRRNGKET